MRNYKEKIFNYLSSTTEPVDIEKIRKACGIGNWNTALNYCLRLLIEGKINGQKTSKSWVFWIHQETHLRPWDETIGHLDALQVNEDNVVLTLSRAYRNLKIAFPRCSPEAQTLTQTLTSIAKGTKIALLKTDSTEKPLIVKVLNARPVAHKRRLQLLWVRTRLTLLCYSSVGLLRESFGGGCWSCV